MLNKESSLPFIMNRVNWGEVWKFIINQERFLKGV